MHQSFPTLHVSLHSICPAAAIAALESLHYQHSQQASNPAACFTTADNCDDNVRQSQLHGNCSDSPSPATA